MGSRQSHSSPPAPSAARVATRRAARRNPRPRHLTTTVVPRPSSTRTSSQRPYRMYYNPRSGLGYVGPRLPHLITPQVRVYY